ncbi:MAG: ATP-binding protein [Bacteroidota bacterium]
MRLKKFLIAVKADAFWKERLISGFMVAGYMIGNGIELIYGKVSDDPAAIWVLGILLGMSVIISSLTKYRSYTPTLFKFFLLYLNFNIIYAYGTSIKSEKEGELFYLLFCYVLFVITSQGLDSRRELLLFSLAEVIIFAVIVVPNLPYNPLFADPMQLFTFLIVLSGSYLISTQRIRLTQAGGSANVQFKALSENGRDAQLILNNKFQFVYLNPAAETLTGYKLQGIMKRQLFDLMADEFKEKVEKALKRVDEGKDVRLSVEYKLKNVSNIEVWVESIFSAFKSAGGADENLIFAETRNIEERKKLEEEIQKQLRIEEMLIKHSNQFINVERMEIQQGINEALGEFGKMLEADAVLVYRMQGKLQDEFRCTNQWFVNEEQKINEYFRKGVKISQQLIVFLRSMRGDKSSHGDFVSVNKLIEIQVIAQVEMSNKTFYLIPLQSGNVVNGFVIFAFGENVNHVQSSFFGLIGNMVANAFTRLRTEIRLHEAQLTNEFILRALPDWLYMINKNGEFTGSNNYSTLPPYIPDYDLIGKTFRKVLPENVASLFTNALNNVIESDISASFEYRDTTIHKDRFFKVIIAPFKANEYLLIIRDITDLRSAQSELENKALKLEQSNKELEEFAYIVSHDMKQPIRTIISYLTLLKKKHSAMLNQEANEFLKFSIDGANKMSDLIRDILQYSKLEQQLSFVTDVSLDNLLKKVLDGLRETITSNNAEIIHDKLPAIKGNETMLTELFQNLIENGIKYNTNKSRTVTIQTIDQDNFWKFSVTDNGIGFDQQYAEQIFKIFKRLHNDEEFQGTGIGLSICHKVVEKHGGKIWAVSEKGKGSTFSFTLPK